MTWTKLDIKTEPGLIQVQEEKTCGNWVRKGLVTFSKFGFENNVSLIDVHGTFQLLLTKVKGITIISVYQSSNCSNLESIMDFVSQYKTEYFLVIGNFNFTQDTKNLLTNQLKVWNFNQLIDFPTHKEGTTIDHAYVSKKLSTSTVSEPHYTYYSDHQGLFLNIIKK